MELKKLIRELLEAVPFDKTVDIYHALKSKYDELEGYTFGVEFEFQPNIEPLSRDQIIEKLAELFGSRNDNGLQDGYAGWLEEHRENAVKHWARRSNGKPDSVDDFDESYGPMSEDDYKDHIPEPQLEDYTDEDQFNEDHDVWNDKLADVDYQYRRWYRSNWSDYTDDYLHALARSGDWTLYLSDDEQGSADLDTGINEAIDFIEGLGEEVGREAKPTSTEWSVGEDGPNIEIRSRHMRQTGDDFALIKTVGNWVSDQTTSGNTGMHVHIGLPLDFDAFDILAMTTLVDEKAVQKAVSSDRNFSSYAKLRRSISNLLITKIREKVIGKDQTVPKYFTLTNPEVREIIKGFDRNHGTNIAAFEEHRTIEFRYLGTDIAHKALEWIEYFLLLPRIAKSRNKVTLDSIYGETLVATRLPGKIKFTFFVSKIIEPKREKVPMPTLPADMIKQQAADDWIKAAARKKK